MQWGDQYLGYMSGNAEAEFRIEPKSTGVSPARINVSSGGPLEAAIGYSRAVRLDAHNVSAGVPVTCSASHRYSAKLMYRFNGLSAREALCLAPAAAWLVR